eukprot:2150058-Lingulodinium_polyedra.AAC.1
MLHAIDARPQRLASMACSMRAPARGPRASPAPGSGPAPATAGPWRSGRRRRRAPWCSAARWRGRATGLAAAPAQARPGHGRPSRRPQCAAARAAGGAASAAA